MSGVTMRTKLRQRFRNQFKAWMKKRIKPCAATTLNSRTIYVLPTRNGMLFLLSAALIFIAAINYAVSLAFGLAFMMVSLFILAILYTFKNLNQLSIRHLPARSVFCGEMAAFNVEISRRTGRRHEALELGFDGELRSHANLVAVDRVRVQLFAHAGQRGMIEAPLIRVASCFPLGLCRAWSVINLDMHCLVYPRPVAFVMNQFSAGSGGSEESALTREGSEDFYGLREYVPGDPLRQVAWKNVARGQGMQLKQFVDYVDSNIWLDWDMFYGFDIEGRLSRLCFCVLQLSNNNVPFGLKLPGVEIAPDVGVVHRDNLLRALALFPSVQREGK